MPIDMYKIGAIGSFLAGLAAVAGLYLVVLQLRLQRKSNAKNNERKRKQATIEHVRYIRPAYSKLSKELERKFGTERLDQSLVKSIYNDPELAEIRDDIQELLTLIEFTAVGVNTGVLDKDIWFRMSASYIVRLYDKFRLYIDYARHQRKNEFAYVEFEQVAKEFEDWKRTKPDPRGTLSD